MGIKVILADDHLMIRQGIKQLLEFDGTIEVVAEANNGLECLECLDNNFADILLLDINMPKLNGIETLKILRKKKNEMNVLILTVHDEIEYLVHAIEIGIQGYILKDSGFDELRKAISAIISGESYIQPNLIPTLNNYLINKNSDLDKIKTLTKRELQVLIEVANGKFNRDIAENLDISERTVKNHLVSIFKKISVSDRTQAAVFAIKNNLVKI